MDQLRNFADDRLLSGCTYCGQATGTRDHVPSRVFLDSPYPENLPVVAACLKCNNGFSIDEEYLACLLECVIAGSTDPEILRRQKVANSLRRNKALRARIEAAKQIHDSQTAFAIEQERVRNVILKLARGHAAFELSQPCLGEPASIWWHPIDLLDPAQRDDFDAAHVLELFGEIGSRGSQRTMAIQTVLRGPGGEERTACLLINDWMDVQDDRYRYLAIETAEAIKIKIVIAEYLACEVIWLLDEP